MDPAQAVRIACVLAWDRGTYADRLHGAKLGVFSRTAAEDCAVPAAETGNHEQVRWAEINDEYGHGMRDRSRRHPIRHQPAAQLADALEDALHQNELP